MITATGTSALVAQELNLELAESKLSLAELQNSTFELGSLLLCIQSNLPLGMDEEYDHGVILIDECIHVKSVHDVPVRYPHFVITKNVYERLLINRYTHWYYRTGNQLVELRKTTGKALYETLPMKLTKNRIDYLRRHYVFPED